MSDAQDAPEGAGTTGAQAQSTAAPQGDSKAAPQGEPPDATDWKATAEKWQKRANADRDALNELKKQVQGLLTPEQVADKAAAAEAAAADAGRARAEALRLRVALEKGIPADLADRLIGDDRDALEADADKLVTLIGKPKRPVADAAAGTGKPPEAQNGVKKRDPNELLRMLAGHH